MKITRKILGVILACAMLFSLCACNGNEQGANQEQTYTIQYTDSTGVHSIEVETGKLYSISSIPEKNGYDFMGLYDAEAGGTQYVNAGGSSVSAFTDNKDIVLYPQFKAKEYTLVLDYQGAAVTGSRSLTVGYNSLINDLPMNLTMENKNFVGWYTQPNKQGVQVADQYGTIPSKNIVDESIFDLSDPKGYIYLYAGFKGEEFTVTFYFTESGAPEEVKVEYGTPISEVQLETRVDGKAVITWSKKKNDMQKEQVFNGKVTSEMVLYAAEFAPVIDFDSNGGNTINSIIARAGDAINLPTPVRENYKFVGWQTTSGSTFNASTMPTASAKLTAKWQAMIVFDTNGGTEVESISEPQGTKITLPITEKDGLTFVGWYDEDGEKYENTAMPQVSIKLKAKWKNIKTYRFLGVNEVAGGREINAEPRFGENCYVLDLTDLYNSGVDTISVTAHYQSSYKYVGSSGAYGGSCSMAWYSQQVVNEANIIWTYSEGYTSHGDEVWGVQDRTATIKLTCPRIFICLYGGYSSYYQFYRWKDFYVQIEVSDV